MGSVVFTAGYSTPLTGYMTCKVRVKFAETYELASNRTTLRVTAVELQKVGNDVNWGSLPFFGAVKVNGTTLLSMNGGASVRVSLDGGGYCAVSIPSSSTVTVEHDDDGTKSVLFALVGGISYGGASYFGALSGGYPIGADAQTQSVALTPRPRASTIASCPAAIETGQSLALTVSRSSPAFFHKASFRVGETLLHTSEAFAASLSCPIPRSWFSSFPNDASLSVTLAVQTYPDERCAAGTEIGSPAVAALTVTADAQMAPSVSSGWVSLSPYNTGTAAAGISGYVKGVSRAEASFDASKIALAEGASIASYTVSCRGVDVSAAPYRTGVLGAAGTAVVCSVTDSRGLSASESFSALPIMDYAAPSLAGITVCRCDDTGTAKEDGTYITVRARRVFSSLGGQNSCTLSAAFAPSGGAYGAETALADDTALLLGPLSADTSYTVRIRARDALGRTARFYAAVPTRRWAMKFRANGRGVAFGKAPEADDVFEISPDWAVKLGQPLAVSCGGTGAAAAAQARENLGALAADRFLSMNMAANTSYSFSLEDGTRFLLFTASANDNAKTLHIYNVANSGGAVSGYAVKSGSAITLTAAANTLTVRSSVTGAMGFLVFRGSVTLNS